MNGAVSGGVKRKISVDEGVPLTDLEIFKVQLILQCLPEL